MRFHLQFQGRHAGLMRGASTQDWWNAGSAGAFWQRWNAPVRNWMRRHVYEPMMRAGLGQASSALLVFALSAALHELAVAVPLRALGSPYAAVGMLTQVRACSRQPAR